MVGQQGVQGMTIKEYETTQGIVRNSAEDVISLMVNTPLNGISATATIPIFAPNTAASLYAVRIYTDTEIADGDETDNWTFQVRNLTQGEDYGDPVSTNGEGEGVAQYGFKRLLSEAVLDAETARRDVFGLVITKNGTPTDLSSAKLLIVTSYKDVSLS